jgi:hypothetical protein
MVRYRPRIPATTKEGMSDHDGESTGPDGEAGSGEQLAEADNEAGLGASYNEEEAPEQQQQSDEEVDGDDEETGSAPSNSANNSKIGDEEGLVESTKGEDDEEEGVLDGSVNKEDFNAGQQPKPDDLPEEKDDSSTSSIDPESEEEDGSVISTELDPNEQPDSDDEDSMVAWKNSGTEYLTLEQERHAICKFFDGPRP